MFKTVKELKEFIIWAKTQQVKEVHVGKVVVVFSDYGLAEAAISEPDFSSTPKTQNEERDTSRTILDEPGDLPDNDEEILFHSSN